MLVQESFLEDKNMHDTTDELDETLSLCDLPLYGDQSADDWEDDLSAESQGSTSISSSSDHDYFEFFSQELVPFPPENIVFCGKIIPFKKVDPSDTVPPKQAESQQPTSVKKTRGWSMFSWKPDNKNTTLNQKTDQQQRQQQQQQQKFTKKYNNKKQGKGYDLPLHKMSILISSSSEKARWYFFLTGISRFSSGMELRDIKNRQSRRHIYSPPPSPALRGQNNEDKRTISAGSSRLWEVIRLLSCGGNHHPSAMVAGPMSCSRLE